MRNPVNLKNCILFRLTSLLLFFFACLWCQGICAQEEIPSLIYSHADAPARSVKMSDEKELYVYLAFRMSASEQKAYIGSDITAINVLAMPRTSGVAGLKPIKVDAYVTNDPTSVPQAFSSLTYTAQESDFTYITVPLSHTYTITGEEDIYIGYRYRYNPELPVFVTDGKNTSGGTMLVATANLDAETLNYKDYSSRFGSLCCQAIITGEDLPKNHAVLKILDMGFYFNPNKRINYTAEILNLGLNELKTATVRTQIEGTSVDKSFTLSKPIKTNERATVSVNSIPNQYGLHTLFSTLYKANGVTSAEHIWLQKDFGAYDHGYPRIPVIEEGTATWCGWAPGGRIGMTYLQTEYPDWIRISIHNNDEMHDSSFNDLLKDHWLEEEIPYSIVNRSFWVEQPGLPNEADGDDAKDSYYPIEKYYQGIPAFVCLRFQAECDELNESVHVKSYTEMSCTGSTPLQLSFVLVEDGVGPYPQTNWYANGENGAMGGWETKGETVSCLYDNVARYIEGYPGIPDSLPVEFEEDNPYFYECTLPLANVVSGNFRVVGLVVNPETREIMNACEVPVIKASVEAATNPILNLQVVGNSIIGADENTKVYTLDGRLAGTENLAPGIYIASTANGTCKLSVK